MKNKNISLNEAKEKIDIIIKNLNSSTACFTGHRYHKLPWKSNENDERCIAMKITLRCEIEKAIKRGYRTFLCGMALGFDMICAETLLDLKHTYQDIKIVGAIPCKDQDKKWAKKDKKRYRTLLNQLDSIRCIYNEYIGPYCMLERSRYMVNNSSLLIALFNNIQGGTKATIDYAQKQGLEIIIIKP